MASFFVALAVVLGSWIAAPALSLAEEPASVGRTKPVFSHEDYDRVVKKHVKDGLVNYGALKKDTSLLERYLQNVAKFDPGVLSAKGQIAFYVNAYNAYTLKAVLEHYPEVDSIRDIPRVWKKRRYKIGGKSVSLDDIEHGTLRKRFNEPRIHFALVCASKGCPKLRSEAYVGERLDDQLDDNAREYFKDPKNGLRFESSPGFFYGTNHYLYVTKILSWFDEDFTKGGKSVLEFVEKYAPEEAKKFITQHRKELSLKYLRYDWSLNDMKS